jgi:glycerol-3-phosphate O-acyltransferase
MNSVVTLPLWLFLPLAAFAALSLLRLALVPSVRWFFRARAERFLANLNARLKRPIQPLRLLDRNDMIVRLVHDPKVMQAITEHATERGIPLLVAVEEARTYAREIVPGFSALVYFGFAVGLARRISRLFYDIHAERVDQALEGVDPKATVVFVMNHRSNMDYVLVTWLVAGQSSLSYAVGEWARVWPLSWLFRAMGGYFIRRGGRNALYRRVLARYVQISAAEGATQAMFPEGALSLDGRVGKAKLGLLNYLLAGQAENGGDVVFVPVGIAYDRVLEDRVLTGAAAKGQGARAAGDRHFRIRPLAMLGFALRSLWQMLWRRFPGFGRAGVAFGPALSLAEFRMKVGDDPQALAEALMERIGAVVPLLPVPLVAAALVEGAQNRAQVLAGVRALLARLQRPEPPVGGAEALVDEALRRLILRRIVVETNDGLTLPDTKKPLLHFYAAGVSQRQYTLGKGQGSSENVDKIKQDDDGDRNADQPSGDAFHGNLVQTDDGPQGPVAM